MYHRTVAISVIIGREIYQQNLKQELEQQIGNIDLPNSSELGLQGKFIGIDRVDRKISKQIY